jgi:probable HAF family extracellular repeat protein
MATVTILASALLTGVSEANGLNNIGEVVGQEDRTIPFVWRPSSPNGTTGTATQLPVLPNGSSGVAFAINNMNSVIVGQSQGLDANGNVVTRAVRWTGGTIESLGTLIPDPFNPGAFLGSSRALDINDLGQIVGASDTVFGVEHAFLFDPALGFMRDLGALSVTPPLPLNSRATSLNNNGDIVGVSETFDPTGNKVEHGFLLIAGNPIPIDLVTLIPDPATSGSFLGNSGAFGINDNFRFIGTSDISGTGPGGIQLTGAVRFINGSPPNQLLPVHSTGYDIGPANHIVGTFDFPERGFVLHSTTGMVDLTVLAATPGMTITLGTGVNASGQISAMADSGGSSIGVLITQ